MVGRKVMALAAGLILSLAMPTSVGAWTYTTCTTPPPTNPPGKVYSPTWHVYRDTATYYGVQGEVVIRQLHGCTGATGQQNPTVLVFPVNLETTNQFLQVGYGIGVGGGSNMQFYASSSDDNSGNVSPMSIGFQPTIGHTVRFDIYRFTDTDGILKWQLRVDDLSHTGWFGWRARLQNSTNGPKVWFGIEDKNQKSQFGGNSSANSVRLRGLAYRLSNGGAWNYLTGTNKWSWANDWGIPKPGCWINSITTYSGPIDPAQTSLNGYTADNGLALAPLC